jgi:hypothetical protein
MSSYENSERNPREFFAKQNSRNYVSLNNQDETGAQVNKEKSRLGLVTSDTRASKDVLLIETSSIPGRSTEETSRADADNTIIRPDPTDDMDEEAQEEARGGADNDDADYDDSNSPTADTESTRLGSDTTMGAFGDVFFTDTISEIGEPSLEGSTLEERQSWLMEAEHSEFPDHNSIASNDEDIASQTPRRKTKQELAAVQIFGGFLAGREDLRALHEDLLEKLGTGSFIENYRRILKVFVMQLKDVAQTALEKDTVKVFQNRENRRTMALQIVEYIGEEDTETNKQWRDLALQQTKKEMLEDWGSTVYGRPDLGSEGTDVADEESEGESNDGNEDWEPNYLETLTTPYLKEACNFLSKETPLQILTLQLRLLALPSSLREIINATPKHKIKIIEENDVSLSNKCKVFIETSTMRQWDWWPLQSPVPDLEHGQLRLAWSVSCLSLSEVIC